MYEDRPYDLLKEMAAHHVMVEINLTSNDVILGVNGKESSPSDLPQVWGSVALSTDDEGVSRIDLTHEYVRAAETYALSYATSSKWSAPASNIAFCPARASGIRATPSRRQFPRARTKSRAQKSLLPRARRF